MNDISLNDISFDNAGLRKVGPMPSIITKIPTMTDAELLNLFKNAINKLAIGPNTLAQSVKDNVEREWQRRLNRVRAGGYSGTRPKEGMLATLGYHVGSTIGEKTATRRILLAHVIEGELPLVSS